MTDPKIAYEFLEAGANEMKKRKELYDPDKDSDGERSMDKTVQLFNTLTGHNVSEEQGWMFMVCLKMVRSQSGKYNADDYIDGAAYFGLAGESANKERNNDVGKKLAELLCYECGQSLIGIPSMVEYEHTESGSIPRRFCKGCHQDFMILQRYDKNFSEVYREKENKKQEIPFVNNGSSLEQSAKMDNLKCGQCESSLVGVSSIVEFNGSEEAAWYCMRCFRETAFGDKDGEQVPEIIEAPDLVKVGGTD